MSSKNDLFKIPIQGLCFIDKNCPISSLYFEQKKLSEFLGSVTVISVLYLVNFSRGNLSSYGA